MSTSKPKSAAKSPKTTTRKTGTGKARTAAAAKPASKTPAPKTAAPKVEAPKVEAPKVEAPKVEAPKVEPMLSAEAMQTVEVLKAAEALTAEAPAKAAEAVMEVTQTTAKVIEANVARAKEAADKVAEASNKVATKQFEESSHALFDGYNSLSEMNKAQMEAFLSAQRLFAQGIESLAMEMMDMTQASFEAGLSNTQKLLGASSFQELTDLQNDIARTGFDRMLSRSVKLTELTVQVANDSIEPINSNLYKTVESFAKRVA